MRASYYPIFADVRGRRCLVVGGGSIAQRKAAALLRCGAEVTVVSPALTRRLAVLAARGTIRHRARRFRAGDVRGTWLVIAATEDARVNRAVFRAASRARIFANVVDQKPLCSFIAPAIVRRGKLTIAISTNGTSPAVAKHLRRRLEQTLAGEYAPLLRFAARLRPQVQRRLTTYAQRRRYFDQLLQGRAARLLRAGKRRQARQEALALLTRW